MSTDISLTDKDIQVYESNRKNYFKGTITVCVIYGVIALGLFLLALMSDKGRDILSNDLKYFTATLIGGIVIVVILLIIQIMTMKPAKISGGTYDSMICPDYWSLQKTSPAELEKLPSADKYLLQYKCVNDQSNILYSNVGTQFASGVRVAKTNTAAKDYRHADICARDSSGNLTQCGSDDTRSVAAKLRDISRRMYDPSVSTGMNAFDGRVDCNAVFPYLMASEDTKNFPDTPNRLRCKYAQMCGASWTNVCPEPPTADL